MKNTQCRKGVACGGRNARNSRKEVEMFMSRYGRELVEAKSPGGVRDGKGREWL